MDTTEQQTPPPPGGASGPAPRRLVRRTDDRVIAGVASGLGAYTGTDPAIWRIGFVVLGVIGGSGVVAYLIAWLLLPEGDDGEAIASTAMRERHGAGFWIGLGLIAIAATSLGASVGNFGTGFAWPLVLIGIGVALWRAGGRPGPSFPPPATGGAPSGAGPWDPPAWGVPARGASAWDAPGGAPAGAAAHDAGATAAVGGPPPTARPPADTVWWEPPARERRQRTRSYLGRITFAATLIYAGVAVMLDRLEVVTVTLAHVLAAALVIVGLGLVVGSWFGRSRGLILLGFFLLPAVVAVSALEGGAVPLSGGVGELSFSATSAADLDPSYELFAGEVTLNLSELELTSGEPVDLAVRATLGQVTILVPEDVTVEVRARAAAGQINLPDTVDEGTSLERIAVLDGREGAGRLRLDVRVTAGQIDIERVAAPAPQDTEETS